MAITADTEAIIAQLVASTNAIKAQMLADTNAIKAQMQTDSAALQAQMQADNAALKAQMHKQTISGATKTAIANGTTAGNVLTITSLVSGEIKKGLMLVSLDDNTVNIMIDTQLTASGTPVATTTAKISGVTGADALIVGNRYRIKSPGTTDFTTVGASANATEIEFTATGVATGTGKTYCLNSIDVDNLKNIEEGQYVTGTSIPSGTTITNITGSTISLSNNLTNKKISGNYEFRKSNKEGTYTMHNSPSTNLSSVVLIGCV